MSSKFDEQEWLKKLYLRIQNLSKQEQPLIVKWDDEDFFAFDLGKRIDISEKGIEINMGPIGLKTRNGLVGMSGFYYNPKFFGGNDAQTVFDSWNWFINRARVNAETFACAIETSSVVDFLVGQIDEGLLYYFLALPVDLHELDSIGVDVTSKILEIGRQVRNHMRKYEKMIAKRWIQALLTIQNLRFFLADISSESALARFAKQNGLDVKMGIHPDLTISGKTFEVKRVRKSILNMSPVELSNPIRRGLKQNADVVAIEDNIIEKRTIKSFKTTWLGRNNLKNALKNVIKFERKGKCVLLFCGTSQGYFGRIILLK